MVRTTSVRLLLATVSTLALNVAAHAQEPASAPTTDTQTTESQNAPAAETAVVLDTVTVTANKRDTKVIDAPASISVIDEDELERRQASDLSDILRGLPGVEIYGGPRSTVQEPIIRGLTGDRVVVRVDGVRANMSVGHKGRFFFDPEVMKSVEVYRGAASTMQGTGALGGVIALTTKDANDLLEAGENLGARVKVGYASVDHGLTTNGMAYGRPTENTDFLVSLTRESTGNFEAGDGNKQPYTDDDYINGLVKGGIDINDASRLTLALQRYSDDHQLPAAPDSGAAVNSTSNYLVNRESEETSMVLGYSYHDSSNDLIDANVNAYGMRTDLDEKRVSDGRHDERTLDTIGLDGSNTSRFDLSGRELAVTVGGEIYQDSQEGRRDGVAVSNLFPDADMTIYGVYVDNAFAVTDALDVTAGVRFDSYDLSASGQRSREDSAVSPRFSASYRVTEWMQPYISYAEAFRAPAMTEMYASGYHFPGNNFVANPDLEAEKAKTWEFGTNFKSDNLFSTGDALRAKVAYFQNDIEDYIEQQGATFGSSETRSVNVPEAEIKGFEAEISYDTGLMFAGLVASRIRGENTRTGANLSNIPADKVALSGGYRFADQSVEVGGRANIVDRLTHISSGYEVPGYATFDLFVRWDADETLPGLSLNAGIDNLLDRNYQTADNGLYEPGRNFKISASMKF
ncbi:TonB-dependent hemoglobin/transferrin/lactoferrin family receptor [Thalassospira sp.]|uniref:TonB-dependent hemoglobin/transferrin/lactoferrin family receptor n=1 Tax=Thalassospira sp. TaxID=1912094 RepID=UPI000C40E5CE|nr:TonB-dependent hemoglobin/transferrin/lactoferrin family receptor [Thalassospira sp.]MBC05052.1 TonB-dependent receptor [Thalassospira sp.]|tara:strand:- start:4024 stop:6084 length:2061 start_codon:yes stop_codon:yes gene_type:complete